jgi:Domain of unknown function (DUF1963)
MLDRKYLLVLLILVALTFRAGFLVFAIPVGILLLLGWLGLTLFEAVANFVGPRLQRDLITFRYKPKRAAKRLIRHLGLDQARSQAELTEKAQALAKAALAVTLRHPNPIYGPLRLDRLAKALEALLPPANKAFARELRKAWINPSPGLSLGGLVLRLRAAVGGRMFGKWTEIARTEFITGATSAVSAMRSPAPDQPWMTPDYPGQTIFVAWQALADTNGLNTFPCDPALLPLTSQRKLAALTAQLYGTPGQARLARFLNPSIWAMLGRIAAERAKWEPWRAAQADVASARASEQSTRQSYRAKDSLTQDEIIALIADRAQNSILLNRVWPPGTPAPGNSWLGGLPCLPPDMDWPRNKQTGLPLHFLAQVDCADLPTLGGVSPLPRDGLLLFFSDLDEERLAESDAVVHVPKVRQSVPPRALPDDLPEIDHGGGKPATHADNPGQRHYPKWPVVPTAVKIWAGEEDAHPKTFNRDYLEQSRAAHDASLAAVMPPPVESTRMADIFPVRQRKDAEGKTIRTPEGKAIPYTVFDPTALPDGFPFCGAGIDAFVTRLQQQATKAARRAATDRSFIDAKWNDTEEKRARKRAEADQADADARAAATLATQARDALGTLPALLPVPQDRIVQMHRWLAGLAETSRNGTQGIQSAVSGSLLDLARASVTDPDLAARLPASVYAAHAISLLPSPRHSQHLMLGPAQTITNSTARGGVRLLCLDSDYGPGMMFCDCGVIEYWIAPEDLAAQRFDRVRAETAGG